MYIYITLFAIEALMVIIGFLIGLKRGTGKAIVRFIELIIAAVASFLIGKAIVASLTKEAFANTGFDEKVTSIIDSAPLAKELVAGLAGALVLPIIFAIIFFVLKLISLIGLSAITKFFTHLSGEKTPTTITSRLLGGAVGALTSIVVASVMLCPLYTGVKVLVSIPEETLFSVGDVLELNEADVSALNEMLPHEDMTPPVSALVVNLASTFTVDDTYNATEETARLLNVAVDVWHTYDESSKRGDDDLLKISAMISASVSHLNDSTYIAGVTTSVFNSIGENLKNGNDIFGITAGMDPTMADMMLKSIGDILTGITPENISAIAGDGKNDGVFALITEITSCDNLADVLNDSEKIEKLTSSLITMAQNPELSSTMDALTEIGTGMLSEALPENRDEYLGKLSESVNEVLSATKDTQDNFEESVDTATAIIKEKISQVSDKEVTEGEAKLLAICALHNFGTAENYADSESSPISVEDIENLFSLNK